MIFKRRSFILFLAGFVINCFRLVFNPDVILGIIKRWNGKKTKKHSESINSQPDQERKINSDHESKAHFMLDQWLSEVPYDICSDQFQDILKNDIEDLIGYNHKTVRVTDYGAIQGTFSKSAFEAAVNATPSGGTLIIPEGTWYINQWEINKSIRIKCYGTLKREDYGLNNQTRSNYMVRLSSPCNWDGGFFDSNFRSWKAGENSNRLFLLRNTSDSIIRNIQAIDCARKKDGYNWGGFRNENGNSYWENCSAEYAARSFSNQANRLMYSENESGKISAFKGVYYYRCNALNFTEKGFDSGGSHGWIIYDKCGGNRVEQDHPNHNNADELFLLETGNENKLHTAIIKNCRVEGHHSAQMIKSSGVKYMIMANNHFVTWGFFNRSTNQPGRIYFAQIKSTPQHSGTFQKTIGIFINNHFECRDFDDGMNTYFPDMTGRCHPLTANWNGLRGIRDLTSEFYLYNCTIHMHGNSPNRYSLELKKFYAENCTYIKVLPGNAYQYFRPRGLELKPEDGYKYAFKNCTFKSENETESWIVDRDKQNGGSFAKGTVFIQNPAGDFNNNLAPAYMIITKPKTDQTN